MATMLQIVQQATGEMGLSVPTQVAGNTATDVVQILALLNSVGYELMAINDHDWQKAIVEYRFDTEVTDTTGDTTNNSAIITNIPSTTGLDTTFMVLGTNVPQDTYIASVDSATQVTLTNALTGTETGAAIQFCKTKYTFPSDYNRLVNRTQWDKTNHWEMVGPQSSQEWQWLKSGYVQTTPRVRFRQLGGTFQIWPPQAATNLYGFEYVSNNWVYSVAGEGKSAFTADDDTCIFPDRLMVAGLKLKYFSIKGFDTTDLRRDYDILLVGAQSGDTGAPNLNLAARPQSILISYNSVPDSGFGQSS
jgi:hypothetical protein